MVAFAGLGLIFFLQITAVVQIIHRLFLVIRTPTFDGKRWKTAPPEMRAWRFSAIEPLVTTLVTIPALITFPLLFDLQKPTMSSVLYILPILNMMFYSWRISKHGEGGRLARLAITVIWTRILLVLTSAFFFILDVILSSGWSEFPYWRAVAPILCAFCIRAAFTVHQNLVMDKMDVDAAASRQRRITLIEDSDLWDEQVELIERLKAEEGTDSAQTVGRAQELV